LPPTWDIIDPDKHQWSQALGFAAVRSKSPENWLNREFRTAACRNEIRFPGIQVPNYRQHVPIEIRNCGDIFVEDASRHANSGQARQYKESRLRNCACTYDVYRT
jgi:hypothetical protein